MQVLLEFKEYATEVDVDFVRRSVRAIGRCAISLERAAERCINVLLELIQTKVNYVVQEAIIVIKDIFRRYPNRSGHELQFQADYFVWQAASQGLSSTTQCPSTNPLYLAKLTSQQLTSAIKDVCVLWKCVSSTSIRQEQRKRLHICFSCCTQQQSADSNPVF